MNEANRAELETESAEALSEKDEKIQYLQRRLRKAERRLNSAEEEQLPTKDIAHPKGQDLEKLTCLMEELEAQVLTIFGSRRWRVGSAFASLYRRLAPGMQDAYPEDSVHAVLERFQAWKQGKNKESLGFKKEETPASRVPNKNSSPETNSGSKGSNKSQRFGPGEKVGIRKVQVGCGPHNLMDDWWNVDVRRFNGIDAVMDATEPWPYEGLQYVFGEHFLEHLTLDGGLKFLEHAGNSLAPGGIIRLSTPNLEYVLRTHYPTDEQNSTEHVAGTLRMNRAFHGWGHQFLYSKDMLQYILTEMGFAEVAFFSYGESKAPMLKGLERHGKFRVKDGHPSVVIVEAKKGEPPVSPSHELSSLVKKEYLRYVNPGAH